MRILHTSDWHLGRSLEGRDRIDEQEDFLVEICDIADQEKVDLVLLAGDVFDTFNPSAKAEELFYKGLYHLSQGGRRAIVVIAGNHDNPKRLRAANSWAEPLGISLIGLPKDKMNINRGAKVVDAGIGWLEINVAGCAHNAVILTLPYPSEQRLKEVLADSLNEEEMQKSYSARVGRFFADRVQFFRKDTVNICTSHLFVQGGLTSKSERPLQLGGAYTVATEMLPSEAQYIALGHLHRPQKVGGAEHIRYSGSPLAYSFSEAGYTKSVFIVDCKPDTPAQVNDIILSSGRPLVKWEAKNGLGQVHDWCSQNKDVNAWIDLTIHLQEPLKVHEIKNLRESRPGIIHIRPILPEMNQVLQRENRINLPVESLFRQFYSQKHGLEPNQELVQLFFQLLEEDNEEDIS